MIKRGKCVGCRQYRWLKGGMCGDCAYKLTRTYVNHSGFKHSVNTYWHFKKSKEGKY